MTDTRSASARRSMSTPSGGRTATPGGRPASTPARGRKGKAPAGSWPVRERSLIKPVLGIPPVAALGIAVGTTALGVVADLIRLGTVGVIFEVGYFLGCVLAVAWVRRRSIFAPAIAPPLLLAVVVPVIAVLIGAPSPEAGTTENLLMAGAPLINAFPAMAVTTAAVLLLAGFRLVRQRTGPDDAFGQVRRRLSGGRSGATTSDGGAGRGGATTRATGSGTDRARRRSGAARSGGPGTPGDPGTGEPGTSGSPGAGDDRAGRPRRRTAPAADATRATGARSTAGSGRAAPTVRQEPGRTGTSRSPAGSARADEPARPRRPRRT